MQNCQQNMAFVALVLITAIAVSDGQFFTKTGSKSIPRMGRRADNSLWSLIPRHSSHKANKLVETLFHKLSDRNNSESSDSKGAQIEKTDHRFDPQESDDNEVDIDDDKSRNSPLTVEEDSDDRFDTALEVRKLEKILNSYVDRKNHKTL